ncbi:hypothetical protein ABPG74_007571 [Tetrahymena malaccensis]
MEVRKQISNQDQKFFCQKHNKQLKYLNYYYKQNSGNIFICKQCTKDLDLQNPLKVKKLIQGNNKSIKEIQEMSYQKVELYFQEYQRNLSKLQNQVNKYLQDQSLLTQIYIDEAKQQVKKDQKYVRYDIYEVIKSFKNGNLGLSEFEQEIAQIFQREENFQNFQSKKFQIFNTFIECFSKLSNKFITEMSKIHEQNFEKEELQKFNPTSSQINLIQENLNILEFNKQVEQYSKQGNMKFLHKYETIPNNKRILKQMKLKSMEIQLNSLERSDQIKVIITKNAFAAIPHITQSLTLLKPFYQQLQILHINNITKSKYEINQLVGLLSEQNLTQLKDLSFGISKHKYLDNKILCKYFREFFNLYPNLQNLSLNLGKQDFDDTINSITQGLSPLKKQLISLQLKLRVNQQMNPDLIENFYQNILNQSTSLKILSLKFLKNQLKYNENFIYLFQGFSKIAHQFHQLRVIDLQIDLLGKGISNINELTNFIKSQKQLLKLKLFFDSYNKLEYFSPEQANQIITCISNHQNLITLVLKFEGLYNIQKESIIHLSSTIQQNKQIEELNLKFPQVQQIDEEAFDKLSLAIKDLQKISILRFNMAVTQISDQSLNKLIQSLAHTKKLEEFELNLKNSKLITDQPVLNLIHLLSNQKKLKKMLLDFEKSQKINPKILQLVTKYINEGSFQHLKNIQFHLGSNKFDSQTETLS